MLKANLRKIVYLPDINQPQIGVSRHYREARSQGKNISHFEGLNFIDKSDCKEEIRPKKAILVPKNESNIVFNEYNRKGNEPIPINNKINSSSVGYNFLQNKSNEEQDPVCFHKRQYSQQKSKSNITPDYSVTEQGSPKEHFVKRIIPFSVSEEYKKLNSKQIAKWDKEPDLCGSKVSREPTGPSFMREQAKNLLKYETKNKDMTLLNGAYRFNIHEKPSSIKKLIEYSYLQSPEKQVSSEAKQEKRLNVIRSYSAIKSKNTNSNLFN